MLLNKLEYQQIASKVNKFAQIKNVVVPPVGWIRAIRLAIGMTLEQLGKRMKITKQAVRDMERREMEGAITIKSLKEIAKAMDMNLVYGFVPIAKSMDDLIEKRAIEIATEIVKRTSASMKLEGQENSRQRIEKAIKERANDIIDNNPKILWD